MVAALWSSMRLLWPQWLVKLWLRGSAGRQRWCSWQLHCSAENFFMCSWCCLWCDLAFLSSSIWMIKSFPFGADWRGSQACWETNIRGKSAVGRLEVSVAHRHTWPEGGGRDKIWRNSALSYWVIELYTHSIPKRDPTNIEMAKVRFIMFLSTWYEWKLWIVTLSVNICVWVTSDFHQQQWCSLRKRSNHLSSRLSDVVFILPKQPPHCTLPIS